MNIHFMGSIFVMINLFTKLINLTTNQTVSICCFTDVMTNQGGFFFVRGRELYSLGSSTDRDFARGRGLWSRTPYTSVILLTTSLLLIRLHILCIFTFLCSVLLCIHAAQFTPLNLSLDNRLGLCCVTLSVYVIEVNYI